MGAFIAKMLLPTVSSLVLLPTASVAAKRGFHMEAMVYFFTMFFIAVGNPLGMIVVFFSDSVTADVLVCRSTTPVMDQASPSSVS